MDKKLLDIAKKVMGLNPKDRSHFFNSVMEQNPALVSEIKAYVDAHDTELLTETMGENADWFTGFSQNLIGSFLGPYRIEKALGEGGMGFVFLGHQEEPLRRKVAIKIIKPGMNSSLVLNRFSVERQALAMMNHRHIAKIFDAGATKEGLPYFVMEYIEGKQITSFCDHKKLTIPERLDLFLQVCDAIQHANQKGILHRDLKPSNILVTKTEGVAEVKVIDFGIAKALESSITQETFQTELGRVVGTLEYMSPEQVSMNVHDIDTRSDVYTLGVLLQELLYGVRPFHRNELKESDFLSVQKHILLEEPVKPTVRFSSQPEQMQEKIAEARGTTVKELKKLLRGDLDLIVVKAQAKLRDHRYTSPHNLKSDLKRYLAQQPVLAGPPDFSYRFKKFASRHRVAMTFSIALLLTLLGALFGVSYSLVKARQANAKSETTVELLKGFLASADPNLRGPDLKVMSLLNGFEPRLAEIQDRDVQIDLSYTMAGTYLNLGNENKAASMFQAILNQLDGEQKADRLWIAKIQNRLNQLELQNRPDDALRDEIARFQKTCQTWFGDQHPETLRAQVNHVYILNLLGKNDLALPLSQELMGNAIAILGKVNHRTLRVMALHARILSEVGPPEKALEMDEEVYANSKVIYGEKSPRVITTLANLSSSHQRAGNYAEALKLRREAYAKAQASFGENHPTTIWIREILTNSFSSFGFFDEALELAEINLAASLETYGQRHIYTMDARSLLAGVYSEKGRFDDALTEEETAREYLEHSLGGNHAAVISSLGIISRLRFCLGEMDSAISIQREILALAKQDYSQDTRLLHIIQANLAVMEAVKKGEQDLDAFGRHFGNLKTNYDRILLLADLFLMLKVSDSLELFEPYFESYYELLVDAFGLDAPRVQNFLKHYHGFAVKQGHNPLAQRLKAQMAF